MDRQEIIMSFTMPPSGDDLTAIARDAIAALPEELAELCEDLALQIDELPDEALEAELDLEDPYDLVALFRSGKQISPGVEKKVANDDDMLVLFRRPLLDLWCETGEDLGVLVRQVIIEELAQHLNFSDHEIEDLTRRCLQNAI